MRIYRRLTPLSEEEKRFAEENHWVINWFFCNTGYDINEFYDIVIFGYLRAVQNWHVRPELHKYSFVTIARQAMRSSIGNEMSSRERRVKTISLDAPVSEDGGISLMDTITYENYQNYYVS